MCVCVCERMGVRERSPPRANNCVLARCRQASAAASTRAEIQEVLDEQARKKRKAGATEAEGKAPKRQKEFKF